MFCMLLVMCLIWFCWVILVEIDMVIYGIGIDIV